MGRFLLPADVTAQELQALIHETWRKNEVETGEMEGNGVLKNGWIFYSEMEIKGETLEVDSIFNFES